MSDSKKYEEAIKQITEAASRYYHLLSPTLCSDSVEKVSAFNYGILEAKVNTLEQLSGMTLDDILAKFAAGWVLVPTKYPGVGFDEELCKNQLSDDAAQGGNVLQLYGKRLFSDGYITKLKFEDDTDTDINFDEKPEE